MSNNSNQDLEGDVLARMSDHLARHRPDRRPEQLPLVDLAEIIYQAYVRIALVSLYLRNLLEDVPETIETNLAHYELLRYLILIVLESLEEEEETGREVLMSTVTENTLAELGNLNNPDALRLHSLGRALDSLMECARNRIFLQKVLLGMADKLDAWWQEFRVEVDEHDADLQAREDLANTQLSAHVKWFGQNIDEYLGEE